MENRESYVRSTTVYLGLAARALVILLPVYLFYLSPVPGFRQDQFSVLMFLLMPVSCLYFTFLTRYVQRSRYRPTGGPLPRRHVSIGYMMLVLLTLAQLALIITKGLNNTLMDDTWFYFAVALFESAMAGYAAIRLSSLFGKTNPS